MRLTIFPVPEEFALRIEVNVECRREVRCSHKDRIPDALGSAAATSRSSFFALLSKAYLARSGFQTVVKHDFHASENALNDADTVACSCTGE